MIFLFSASADFPLRLSWRTCFQLQGYVTFIDALKLISYRLSHPLHLLLNAQEDKHSWPTSFKPSVFHRRSDFQWLPIMLLPTNRLSRCRFPNASWKKWLWWCHK
ncbi:hypothetical protein LXL04_026387 [Taraxacum kok-saghyz]